MQFSVKRGAFYVGDKTQNEEKALYLAKRIERDRARFQKIVRGAIRSGIRKYISHGELIGRKGKDLVSIPLPQLEIPALPLWASPGRGRSGGWRRGDPVALDPNGQGRRKGRIGPGGTYPRGRIDPRRTGRNSWGKSWPCPGSSPGEKRTFHGKG